MTELEDLKRKLNALTKPPKKEVKPMPQIQPKEVIEQKPPMEKPIEPQLPPQIPLQATESPPIQRKEDFSAEDRQRIIELAKRFNESEITSQQPPEPSPEEIEEYEQRTLAEINSLFNPAVYRHSHLELLQRIVVSLERLEKVLGGEK